MAFRSYFLIFFKHLCYNPPTMAGERLSRPQETAKLIFSVGKTPQPEDEKLNQVVYGVVEKIGKLEDILKHLGNPPIHQPKPEELGHPPDLSQIPQWRSRKRDGRPLDFLQTHYGQWLSAFGAEQDNVFMDQ